MVQDYKASSVDAAGDSVARKLSNGSIVRKVSL
eukprot:COSAG03_NODE_19248_length_340_cov_0.887967_1_plen_32_part_10